MQTILWVLFAYLLASVPFGLIVGKVWGSVDVRKVGSGNIGTSNVMRTVGRGAAGVVLVLDVLKGAVPVWLVSSRIPDPGVIALVGVAAVCGHVWSAFLKFDGGKGIATTLGVVIGLNPLVAATLLAVWIAVVALTRYISVASLVAGVWMPFGLWLAGAPEEYILAAFAITVIAFWRHRSNISRLLKGTEYRFGEKAGKAERR